MPDDECSVMKLENRNSMWPTSSSKWPIRPVRAFGYWNVPPTTEPLTNRGNILPTLSGSHFNSIQTFFLFFFL